MTDAGEILGVILAGGRGRRMGGRDKSFIELAGQSLLARTITRFSPQVSHLVLSANCDPTRFMEFNLPVLPDPIPDFAGPLAGLLAAMEWARDHAPAARWLAGSSVDTPFLPLDLVAKLKNAQTADQADIVCAWSDGRLQPLCGLWRIDLAPDLRHALVDEGLHKVDAWIGRHKMATVDFLTDPIDPFFNINCAEDLATAEALLASRIDTLA